MYLINAEATTMELPANLSSLTKADLLALVVRQSALIEQLEERVKGLEGRLNKDSHRATGAIVIYLPANRCLRRRLKI